MQNTDVVNYPSMTQRGAQNVAAARESTQLESLLHRLYSVRESLGGVANRSLVLADRLLGSEPAVPSPSGQPLSKDQAPLVHRLEQVAEELQQISETLHHHLNRLGQL